MGKTIVYFVDDISTSFVINDIRMVSERFDHIILLSTEKLDNKESLPSNVRVIEAFMEWNRYNWWKVLVVNLFGLLRIYFIESKTAGKLLPFKKSIALLCSNIFKAEEVKRQLRSVETDKEKPLLMYSFWFYDCIYLAWLKSRDKSILAVARAHSGDLYEDHISISDKLLFRNYQLKYLNAIYPVSNMGTDYLSKRYPSYAYKFKTIFLGTLDKGVLNPFDPGHFVLVSCASLRHHKRIHSIAETLLSVNIPMTWYHFGNENLHTNDPKIAEYIKMKNALSSKPNIRYIPAGYTENEALYRFYEKTPVSLFISLSEAEGIPVSIMEAVSFGIPVLSTDVGGCSEIVNQYTGRLIPLETKPEAVAKMIEEFSVSEMNTKYFRENVREYWLKHFEMKHNYEIFYNELSSIVKKQF